MKQIKISDVTMRQSSKLFSLSFREKIELAKLLDGLGVSVIELEGIGEARTDALRVKSVAAAVKNRVRSVKRLSKNAMSAITIAVTTM